MNIEFVSITSNMNSNQLINDRIHSLYLHCQEHMQRQIDGGIAGKPISELYSARLELCQYSNWVIDAEEDDMDEDDLDIDF
jgi:hypothetical protein